MINSFMVLFSVITMMGNSAIVPQKLKNVNDIYSCKSHYQLNSVVKEKGSERDSSIVYIGYTKRELVFFIQSWQKGINASSRRRNSEGLLNNNEDAVYILLGTNGIGNDSYFIGVNPLGTIIDKVVSSSGTSEWDGDIKAHCTIRKDGWDALLEIPFGSISYSDCVWGIQMLRIEISKMLIQYLYPSKSNNILRSEGGMKLDFGYINKRGNFDVSLIPSTRMEINNGEKKYFAGGTIRYKKGTGDLLDITINPDFSEVETDVQKFNLNRLPWNYPEKRPFFVEGNSLIKSPVLLFRSRNIESLQYGVKFYDVSDKSSFITYLISDTITGKSSISRFAYSPFENLKIGTYFQLNNMGDNMVSADINGYIKKINLNMQGQISNEIAGGSNLYYIDFSRDERPGYSFDISYTSIDSQFINNFNEINIYFDGINKIRGYGSYYYSKDRKYFVPSIEYTALYDKYSSNRVYNELYPSVTLGYFPLFGLISFNKSNLDYLGLPDCKTETATFGVIYMKSSWNQANVTYSFGNYLGGDLKQFSGDFKISLFGKYNVGFSGYKVKSNYDDLIVAQLYGNISLYKNYMFLKPYLNYTVDNLNDNKNFLLSGIFIFEPKFMTGMYAAISRDYTVNNGFHLNSSKSVFKIKVGFSIKR